MYIIRKLWLAEILVLLLAALLVIPRSPAPLLAADSYTIKAVACAGGSITHPGTNTVSAGDNLTFTITPDDGHHIQDVWVDLTSIGTPPSYTFSDIQADHTIAVSFAPYELEISSGHLSVTIDTEKFKGLELYGQELIDNSGERWRGVPLYILIQQLYPGDSTSYTVSAVSSDGTNDITFTNDAEYPFLATDQKDLFIVADQFSADDGVTWTPIPPISTGRGGWTWAPLRLTGPRQDGSGSSAFRHNGAGLVKLELTNLPPWIITQPTDAGAAEGETAVFNVYGGGEPEPAIQWQELSTAAGADWQSISDAVEETLTLEAVPFAHNGYQYRTVFTSSAGTVNSEAATLTVWILPSITSQPEAVSVRSGAIAVFTAAADGDPLPSVQWQVSSDSGNAWNDISDALSSTLTLKSVTTGQNGYLYRALFSNKAGSTATEAAKLTVTKSSGGGGGGSSSSGYSLSLSGFSSGTVLAAGSSGTASQNARLTTLDGKVTLDIARGTTLLNARGVPLTALSAATLTSPPSAPVGHTLISACTLGPDGAQFTPAIGLSFVYDPAALPAGVTENDLYLASLEESGWVKAEAGQVDTATHTVKLSIAHFSSYALLGRIVQSEPTPSANPAPASSTAPASTQSTTPLTDITVTPSSLATPAAPVKTASPTSPLAAARTTTDQSDAPAPSASSPTDVTVPADSEATGSAPNWVFFLIAGLVIALIVVVLVWWNRRKKP